MIHVEQTEKALQMSKYSDLLGLFFKQISAEIARFVAKTGVPPVDLLNHIFQLPSSLLFFFFKELHSSFQIYFTDL